jgi:hypothetical protein
MAFTPHTAAPWISTGGHFSCDRRCSIGAPISTGGMDGDTNTNDQIKELERILKFVRPLTTHPGVLVTAAEQVATGIDELLKHRQELREALKQQPGIQSKGSQKSKDPPKYRAMELLWRPSTDVSRDSIREQLRTVANELIRCRPRRLRALLLIDRDDGGLLVYAMVVSDKWPVSTYDSKVGKRVNPPLSREAWRVPDDGAGIRDNEASLAAYREVHRKAGRSMLQIPALGQSSVEAPPVIAGVSSESNCELEKLTEHHTLVELGCMETEAMLAVFDSKIVANEEPSGAFRGGDGHSGDVASNARQERYARVKRALDELRERLPALRAEVDEAERQDAEEDVSQAIDSSSSRKLLVAFGCSPLNDPLPSVQREIQDVHQVCTHFQVEERFGKDAQEFVRALHHEKPVWAVLFCGHGHTDDGFGRRALVFTQPNGLAEYVSDDEMVRIIRERGPELVVLNACRTEGLGEKLHNKGNGTWHAKSQLDPCSDGPSPAGRSDGAVLEDPSS